MRLKGMLFACAVVVGACGDDDAPHTGSSDGSLDGSLLNDSGYHILPDAHAADGGPIYVRDDGQVVMIEPDGAVEDSATPDGGTPDATMQPPCIGPFAIATASGAAPLFEAVQCGAGNALYDWGEGAGFGPAATHRYMTPGTFTVTQKAADGTTSSATVTVTSFTPVKFSTTDHTVKDDALYTSLVTVSADGFEFAQGNGTHDIYSAAVRSDGAIMPGAGVFYFEGHRLTPDPWYRGLLGISTGPSNGSRPPTFDFNNPGGNHGVVVYNMGDGTTVSPDGSCAGGPLDFTQLDTGFVVDYRGATPTLHILQDVGGTAKIVSTCATSINAPVFIYAGGERATLYNELRINTGADTTNQPFHFADAAVRAALGSVDASASAAIVMGFGRTNAGRPDSPPSLNLPADMTVAINTPVTLTGTATDIEDGDITSQISWVDRAPILSQQTPGTGASYTFTASTYGVHPVLVSVRDLDGVYTTKTVTVTVSGKPAVQPTTQMVATSDSMNARVDVSADGLSVGFRTYNKDGVRANQGLIGDFWYFEAHRNNPTRNLGIGLVVENGPIVDYDFDPVPWSCSINILHNGSAYINLILQNGGGNWEADGNNPVFSDYGYAVDFRGETPVAYVIIGNKLQTTLKLRDTYQPVFPMLYGNGPDSDSGGNPINMGNPYDFTVKFSGPFAQNPATALTAAGIDATGLKQGWGASVQ